MGGEMPRPLPMRSREDGAGAAFPRPEQTHQEGEGAMKLAHFDFVIVGSGAGLMVMEAALSRGLRCALIEKGKLGGTCLTKGCIPSKMLVYPADFIREAEQSRRIGIEVGRPVVHWDVISERMWEQINFHRAIEKNLEQIPGLTVYKGAAAFTGPNAMAVTREDGSVEEITGDHFLLAVGARTSVPPVEGLEEAGYVTSESFFGEKFPKKPWESLLILGGGSISTEFAHIFSAFGTEVTLLVRSGGLLNKEEPEIARLVERQLTKNGVRLLTNGTPVSVRAEGGRKYVTVEDKLTRERSVVECEEIFVASGVKSNADSLALDKAGVETDKNGWIVTNSYLETSQSHIWALGDVNGRFQLRHKANYEAQLLSHNLFSGGKRREARYNAVPWAVFTHPQVAHLGLTEREAREQGLPYRTAFNRYSEVVGGRAMGYREADDDNGFVKVIVGRDKTLLGLHIVGPQAAVLLQPFAYLMSMGEVCRGRARELPQSEALEALCAGMEAHAVMEESMVIHPSLSELTAWVFEKLYLPE